MGEIVLLGADGRARRLDLLPAEGDGGGWRNALPGYHELRVRGDGVWHHAGFVLAADGVAALRLAGERLVDARGATLPAPGKLVDLLARDVAGARAWQAATAALDRPVDRVRLDGEPLPALQAAFVRCALHDDAAAGDRLVELVGELVACAAEWPSAADMARALAAMLALEGRLASSLPIDELIGALSSAGNDAADAERLAAAHALQLVVHA